MEDRTRNQSWPNIRRLENGAAMPAARIDDVAWIAGHWTGEAFGGLAEEIWSPPLGQAMMCMYRMVKDGAVVFYEFLVIVEEGDSLVLKLKHFDASLKGWEEKDVSLEFPLVALTPNGAFFDGLTFRRVRDDRLDAYVLLKRKDGQPEEAGFQYTRVGT
jgi:hypothetical protein